VSNPIQLSARVAAPADPRRGRFTMQELCARYGIRRKTRYKWVARVAEDGRLGLAARSRASHSCPLQTPDRIADLIVAARQRHPDWGPQLLLAWLRQRHPRIHDWPAVSMAGSILKRAGLFVPRRRRRVPTHPGVVDPLTALPNDLWTADF
jgi:putative transposase